MNLLVMALIAASVPFNDKDSRLARGRTLDPELVPTELQEAWRLVQESWARGYNPTVSLVGLDAAKRLAALGLVDFVDSPMPLEVG